MNFQTNMNKNSIKFTATDKVQRHRCSQQTHK